MIPRAHIAAWRNRAPWPDDDLVEQDLILARALVQMFSHPLVTAQLAFRGGTALHKLVFKSPLRYSEDIDLVQMHTGPIREVVQAIYKQLDPFTAPVPQTGVGAHRRQRHQPPRRRGLEDLRGRLAWRIRVPAVSLLEISDIIPLQ